MDVEAVLLELLPQIPENTFTKWLDKRVRLIWLDADDDRLGMTRFEVGPAELVRRNRLKLDPGLITIGLHPRLKDEPELLRHTLAHELVHASGTFDHSKELHDATEAIAPGVSISQSPLLQEKRDELLASVEIKNWYCKSCGYRWSRSTMRKPSRCFKCAALL
jgi:predicted Zn-ribbon and HTH transcriptional regulator